MANPRCIQHSQRAIALWSPLLWIERMIRGTPQRPVWLREKSGTGKASRKRRAGEFRRSIRHRRSGLRDGGRLDEGLRLTLLGRSKFRCAHGRGMQRMPEFQAQVPDPLREDLPKLLAPGGMRTPPICVLLLVFIRENALERSSMQVQSHHIGRSERALWQGRVEQLVDHSATRGANLRLGFSRRMRGDDDPCARPCWGQKQIRAVKECSAGSCFGMGRLLVWWQRQAGLNFREIKETVVLASHHVAESGHICDNGPVAILAIQTHHSLAQGNSVPFHIRADPFHCSS